MIILVCFYFLKKVYEKSKVAPAPQLGNFTSRNKIQPMHKEKHPETIKAHSSNHCQQFPMNSEKENVQEIRSNASNSSSNQHQQFPLTLMKESIGENSSKVYSSSVNDHQEIQMTPLDETHEENKVKTLNSSATSDTSSNSDRSLPNIIYVEEQETNCDKENQSDSNVRMKNSMIQTAADCMKQVNREDKVGKQIKSDEILSRRQSLTNQQCFNINIKCIVPTIQPFPVVVQVLKKALSVNLLSICQICVFLPLNVIPIILVSFSDGTCDENNIMVRVVRLISLITIFGLIGFPILSEKKLDNF